MLVLPVLAASAVAATPPTYDQVMAAPDDVELNLAYARSETAQGHLLSAAAAYERILMVRPEWDSVRLAYAKVLVGLDDRDGALEQLRLIETRNLSSSEKQEAARYRRRLEGKSRNSVTGYLAAGAIYQTDAYGQFYSQFNLPQLVRQQAGSDGVVSLSVDDVLKLSDHRPLAAYFSFVGYNQSTISGPDTRYQVVEARSGLSAADGRSAWRIGGLYRHYWLFGEPYVSEAGGQASFALTPLPRVTIKSDVEAVWQNFHEPLVLQTLGGTNGHDGPRYDVNISINVHPWRQDVAMLQAGRETKSASYRPFAYDAPYVRASYGISLKQAGWAWFTGEGRRVSFREGDPIYLGGARRTDVLRSARVEWDAPIGRLLDRSGSRKALDGLTLQASLGYDRRSSSPPLAGYHSVGGRLLLAWQFPPRK
jgi:hypothetical protein